MKNCFFFNLKAGLLTAFLFAFSVSGVLAQTNGSEIFQKLRKQPATVDGTGLRLTAIKSLPQNSDAYLPTTPGNWNLVHKNVYRYNAAGNMVSRTRFDISGIQKMVKDSIAYDSHGNEIFSGFFTWQNNNWNLSPGSQYLINYNASGQMMKSISQEWQNGTWVNNEQIIYSYHANGEIAEETSYEWMNNAWEPQMRINFTFGNPTILPTEVLFSVYDNGMWAAESKFTNLTFRNGNPTEILSYTGQVPVFTMWVDMLRANYVYDAFGGFVAITEERTTGSWVNSQKYTVSFDSKMNYTGDRTELWQNNNWEIINENQEILTYNATDDITRRIYMDWDINSNTLKYYRREDYTNFIRITGTKANPPALIVNVFPNPTSDFLNIELQNPAAAKIELTDLTGRLVKAETLPAKKFRIDVSALPKGIYLLTLKTENSTQTSKIIKQ